MMPCRMTLLAAHGKGSFSVLGVAEMPMWALPFVSLVLTSIIVPHASFLGHLAGIASGFAVRRWPYPNLPYPVAHPLLLGCALASRATWPLSGLCGGCLCR